MNKTEIRCSHCGAWSHYPQVTCSCSACGKDFSFATPDPPTARQAQVDSVVRTVAFRLLNDLDMRLFDKFMELYEAEIALLETTPHEREQVERIEQLLKPHKLRSEVKAQQDGKPIEHDMYLMSLADVLALLDETPKETK